jgi:hypothetical protein
MPSTNDLTKEIEAARILREQIAAIAGEDEELIRDTLEGETSLREIIAALVANEAEDEAILDGIRELSKRISERKARIERRIDFRRSLIATGMEVGEIRKLETPAGVVTVKAKPPSVTLIEEADIPARFWKPQPPKLDRKELLAALKEGESVPGATMSNGGTTIQIRG